MLSFCLAGCASIDYRTRYYANGWQPGVYPGTREDVDNLLGYNGDFMGFAPEWLYDVITILDLPCSFALDTLCMPYDVFRNWERSVYVKSASFDKVNNTASFSVKNNINKKLSAKAVIIVQETWREDLRKQTRQAKAIGRKTTNIILPPKSTTLFEENVECSPTGLKYRSFRARASIRSYKEAE